MSNCACRSFPGKPTSPSFTAWWNSLQVVWRLLNVVRSTFDASMATRRRRTAEPPPARIPPAPPSPSPPASFSARAQRSRKSPQSSPPNYRTSQLHSTKNAAQVRSSSSQTSMAASAMSRDSRTASPAYNVECHSVVEWWHGAIFWEPLLTSVTNAACPTH